MTLAMTTWLGVDVGGKRKGFDAALVDERDVFHRAGRLDLDAVVALVDEARPSVIGIDSPCRCAPDGAKTRECERLLNGQVCGIRWTPDEATVYSNDYYAWVVEGLALYAALQALGVEAIEVFPTASWTRWIGARAGRRRAAWTIEGLKAVGLDGLKTNQDQRDAIAAALTAREYSRGLTERFGEIVVPRSRSADGDRTASLGPAAGRA